MNKIKRRKGIQVKDKREGVIRTCFKIQKPGRRGVICWNIVGKREGRHDLGYRKTWTQGSKYTGIWLENARDKC